MTVLINTPAARSAAGSSSRTRQSTNSTILRRDNPFHDRAAAANRASINANTVASTINPVRNTTTEITRKSTSPAAIAAPNFGNRTTNSSP